jgi:hypothetical protein
MGKWLGLSPCRGQQHQYRRLQPGRPPPCGVPDRRHPRDLRVATGGSPAGAAQRRRRLPPRRPASGAYHRTLRPDCEPPDGQVVDRYEPAQTGGIAWRRRPAAGGHLQRPAPLCLGPCPAADAIGARRSQSPEFQVRSATGRLRSPRRWTHHAAMGPGERPASGGVPASRFVDVRATTGGRPSRFETGMATWGCGRACGRSAGRCTRLVGNARPAGLWGPTGVDFSPDNRLLASGNRDGSGSGAWPRARRRGTCRSRGPKLLFHPDGSACLPTAERPSPPALT